MICAFLSFGQRIFREAYVEEIDTYYTSEFRDFRVTDEAIIKQILESIGFKPVPPVEKIS